VKKIKALDKAKSIAHLASEKKGDDIILMDMRKVSSICDWFVVVTANTSRTLNAIANTIQRKLSKENLAPLHVEGSNNPNWVLLDYEDVVVHVFRREVRDFYSLEKLWSGVSVKRYEEKCPEKTSQKE